MRTKSRKQNYTSQVGGALRVNRIEICIVKIQSCIQQYIHTYINIHTNLQTVAGGGRERYNRNKSKIFTFVGFGVFRIPFLDIFCFVTTKKFQQPVLRE